MPSRGTGCHPEGPEQPGEMGPCEPHEIQQSQVQGPASGLGQPLVSMMGSRAALPKRTWGYWWKKSWTRADNMCFQSRKPTVHWAASKEVWPAGRER